MVLLIVPITPCIASSSVQILEDRSVAVAGLTIHIRCGGERRAGQPVVVLEAGGGNSADTWRDVHVPIAQFARVCAYDRPGLGSSTASKTPLSARQFIEILHEVLVAAGEPAPYVLVGHSIGGVITALYANAHPDRVVGMVLVDASHEDTTRRFQQAGVAPATVSGDSDRLVEALSKKPWRGTIPLAVLTRGRIPPNGEARNAIWLELQRDWVTRSPTARQIIAAHSGHYIQNDEPLVVIDAVRWVLARVSVPPRSP